LQGEPIPFAGVVFAEMDEVANPVIAYSIPGMARHGRES